MTDHQPQYHATIDRDGTEDEITIRSPEGRPMAFIWFWEDHQNGATRHCQAKDDAMAIIEALKLQQAVKKIMRAKTELAASLMLKAAPDLFAALEKCEAALADIFARYQQDGDEPSETDKQAKEEASHALGLARGEIRS